MPAVVGAGDLERIFREESGRVVATLVRLFGDIDADRDTAKPRRLAHDHRAQPRGRPPAPRGDAQ